MICHALQLVSQVLPLTSHAVLMQSAIDEASANLNKTRAAFKHVIDKAKDPEKDK